MLTVRPSAVTLHGAMDLRITIRAMAEARDVLLLELGEAEDGLAVLSMRAAMLALQASYLRAVSPALDRSVCALLQEVAQR